MNVSVIGLGKLGAPLAAVLAAKGHQVIGVDQKPDTVRVFNQGRAPVFEPGLEELIQKASGRLSATTDYRSAINNSDVSFIIVPTPSEDHGAFSLQYVLEAAESIGNCLRHKEGFHLVVVTSTVMPGATGDQVLPALESGSGKRCGSDFGLCYNPEFVALGSVIRDMQTPDLILIGESDQRSGEILLNLYKDVCENDPPVARMSFVNAELTKLAVNTYVTTKISYANMLAEICERLPGGDVDTVSAALGLDTRIGPKYLKGALGYGGPCFPRDNLAFACLARQLGAQAVLAEATDHQNRLQVPRLAEIILQRLPEGGRVGILGLAYKPNTNVVEEAQGLELASYLLSQGVSLVLYDPEALDNARSSLEGEVIFASSFIECVRQADVVAITTPWDEFRALSPKDLNYSNGRPVLVDCWRILSPERFEGVADYVALGVGPRPDHPR